MDALGLDVHMAFVRLLRVAAESGLAGRSGIMKAIRGSPTRSIRCGGPSRRSHGGRRASHDHPRGVPGQASQVGRPGRARPQGDSGRHHPRHPLPAPVRHVRGAVAGQPQVGRRRPRIHRLLDGPRGALRRPLPPRGGQGRAGPGGARHPRGRQPRTGDPLGRAGQRTHPVRGADALHHVGHRGHAPRPAPGTRLHGALQGREALGSLPRLARRRHRGRQPPVRHTDLRGGAGRHPGARGGVPTQRHQGRRGRPSSRATSRPSSSSLPGANPAPRRRFPDIWPNCGPSPASTAWC